MSDYLRAKNLPEAVALLRGRDDLTILAGGTDIYPARATRNAWGNALQQCFLDISALDELRGIKDRGDHWWIGALTTWSDIVRAPLPPLFNGLQAAAREIGGVQIQNRGTIAGNICTASPAGDCIPCLLALDAEVEIAGRAPRRINAGDFLTGYRTTCLWPDEMVTGIRVRKQAGRSAFRKLGARRYLVISIAMVAALLDVDDAGKVRAAKFAVGACAATAQRLPLLETALLGQRLEPALVSPAHFAHMTEIDDIRASARYRRHAALELTRDIIAEMVAQTSVEISRD